MGPELLEIRPHELSFTFELKKQSMCSVQLLNKSDQYVAFKVKTTSPKKYCVRPNIGVVQPRSTCDFTVTMQAQRVAPPDMQCKDKFLIQSTIVPFGTTEVDITPSMFSKDNDTYIEENKLRVVLLSPPNSPVLLPINGTQKQEPTYEAPVLMEQVLSGAENHLPPHTVSHDMEELKPAKDLREELKPAKEVHEVKEESKLSKDLQEELKLAKDVEEESKKSVQELEIAKNFNEELKQVKDVQELKIVKDEQDLKLAMDVQDLKLAKDVQELKLAKDIEDSKLTEDVQDSKLADGLQDSKLAKDVEELRLAKDLVNLQLAAKDIEKLKTNLYELKSKLSESQNTIRRLREERSTIIEDKQALNQELAMLRMKTGVQKVQMGFPALFVCMVAFISLILGYKLHY